MRILINGMNYQPEKIGIGKYTGEMAEWLAARGHEVRVVTGPPYYPEWKIPTCYSSWRYQKERCRGTTIWRCPSWIPAEPTGLKRLLHFSSFALTSFPVMLRQAFWKPEVVIIIEPPLMCAPSTLLVSRLSGAKSLLHVQDFEVDAAFDLGILKSDWLRKVVLVVERRLMNAFDCVSTISSGMLGRLAPKGVSDSRSMLFPNWVDIEAFFPLADSSVMRKELGISQDKIVVLFSGSMGKKQGLGVVLEAARLAVDDARIQFVLCGDGAARMRLQKNYGNLPNVLWLPLQPIERLNQLLNLADVHLLPQRADVADLVMPSKLTGMLASGRPVVATANSGTQIAQVVGQCGLVTQPGDERALLDALQKLAGDSVERKRLGRMGRLYAEEFLGREIILGLFEGHLLQLVEEGRV